MAPRAQPLKMGNYQIQGLAAGTDATDAVNKGQLDAVAAAAGTVTSVAISGGTTGLTVTGSPITSSGTITFAGTLAVANGGTGLTTLTSNNVILGNGTSAPQFVAPGTSGNVLTSNGTTWTSAAPSSGWMAAYASSDKSVVATTIVADWTGLSFSVAANKNYCFRFVFSCDNFASGGSRVSFSAPSSPSSIWYGGIVGAHTGAGSNPINSGFVSATGSSSAASAVVGWSNVIGIIDGTLFNGSNAGTLQVQVAQSSASGTTTYRKGSFLQYALLN